VPFAPWTGDWRALWRRARVGTLLPYLLAALAVVAAVVLLGGEVERHLTAIERWIAARGTSAVLLFVIGYAVLGSVFVPDLVLGILAGAAFGYGHGLLAVIVGSLLAAALQYALARHLLRAPIARFVASRRPLAAIQGAVRHREFRSQVLLRLTPLNRALSSYLLGATGVRFWPFLAACVGLLPSLALEVYTGYAGKHLARVGGASGHRLALHDLLVVGGLVVAGLVVVLISREARRAIEAAAAKDA
jgi:uncharacterized membrane protein YdjX (TVP38/TMEM64 family)